jgi:hypothetical protein
VDLWSTVLVVVRRWYVSIPAFALSVGMIAAIIVSTPPYYVANGLMVLTAPLGGPMVSANPARNPTLNPLLDFDDGLNITATLLIQHLKSPARVQELTTTAEGDGYTVDDGKIDGPFINVIATSRYRDNADSMVRRVIARARTELDDLEHLLRAPQATYITVGEAVTPTLPDGPTRGKSRAAGTILLLGTAGGLTITYLADAYLTRRTRRRTPASG